MRVQFLAGYGNTIADVPELIRRFLEARVKALHCAAKCDQTAGSPLVPLGMDAIFRSFASTPQYVMEYYPAPWYGPWYGWAY